MKKAIHVFVMVMTSVSVFSQAPTREEILKHRIKEIKMSGMSGISRYCYDRRGNFISRYDDGDYLAAEHIYHYNSRNTPDSVFKYNSASESVDVYEYGAGGDYRVVTRLEEGSDTSFYEADHRIVKKTGYSGWEVYLYDEKKRLHKKTVWFRSDTDTSVTDYTYDSKGRLLLESTRSGENTGQTSYKYNVAGKLESATHKDSWITTVTRYFYGPKGLLSKRMLDSLVTAYSYVFY